MAKLTKDSIFAPSILVKEKALDKTTRIVREIAELEAEKRQTKMKRLRAARLEREANTPTQPITETSLKTVK